MKSRDDIVRLQDIKLRICWYSRYKLRSQDRGRWLERTRVCKPQNDISLHAGLLAARNGGKGRNIKKKWVTAFDVFTYEFLIGSPEQAVDLVPSVVFRIGVFASLLQRLPSQIPMDGSHECPPTIFADAKDLISIVSSSFRLFNPLTAFSIRI